ncbi:CBO0543 family protein [Bacillus sp. EB600]|uniref:CBO0543 family protein n=1 Tax=Bacillus sp. EB600 TaxID=2806345 RepID=UPI00210E7335|nr:CBO0543 family protein [Bacillus sp. EB600]
MPKKRYRYWIKRFLPALLFSSLLGTYLDLIMVGKQLYAFPIRPLPAIFSINLLFTLVGLPFVTFIFLFLMGRWGKWGRAVGIVCFSLGMAVLERKAEDFGLFVHSHSWSHLNTFIGYGLFLLVVHRFHEWIKLM